ncbi:MAG: hypothetical protein LBS05_00945 [Tannerellaceae bacterium]|nr:hypothetical protein [Tannerellaceae bacterium]
MTLVRSQVSNLSKKDIIRFAGVSLIRSLPFLAIKNNFDYWKKEDMQTYLGAVFYGMDIILDVAADEGYTSGATDYTSDVVAIAFTSHLADGSAAAYEGDTANKAAGFVLLAAARAIATSYTTPLDAAIDTAGAAYVAADAAFEFLAYSHIRFNLMETTRARYTTTMNTRRFEEILLGDAKNLRKGRPFTHTDAKIYGPIRDNFREALEAEGCAYWWRLYEQLFSGSFIPDLKALKLRMSAPFEIRTSGAAATARWLEKEEKRTASN